MPTVIAAESDEHAAARRARARRRTATARASPPRFAHVANHLRPTVEKFAEEIGELGEILDTIERGHGAFGDHIEHCHVDVVVGVPEHARPNARCSEVQIFHGHPEPRLSPLWPTNRSTAMRPGQTARAASRGLQVRPGIHADTASLEVAVSGFRHFLIPPSPLSPAVRLGQTLRGSVTVATGSRGARSGCPLPVDHLGDEDRQGQNRCRRELPCRERQHGGAVRRGVWPRWC